MEKKNFKFSVIIPIYNVEKYLEEAIKSIINQSIGFEDNIQLILVNDGSTDNSEEICMKYEKEFPDNIIYIKQKNNGVSVARNTGMKYRKESRSSPQYRQHRYLRHFYPFFFDRYS